METDDIEPAVSSRAHATAEQIREGPERQHTVASLPVCSLLIPVDEILVIYVATHEIDDRPVYEHKTSERLSPRLVKVAKKN